MQVPWYIWLESRLSMTSSQQRPSSIHSSWSWQIALPLVSCVLHCHSLSRGDGTGPCANKHCGVPEPKACLAGAQWRAS